MNAGGFFAGKAEDEAGARRIGSVTVVLLHVGVIAALLQIGQVRQALVDAAPIFINFVEPERPKVEVPPPPVIVPKKPPPLIVSERVTKVPAEFTAPPPPPEPVVESTAVLEAPPAPAPAPVVAAAPKLVSHVEYIRRPTPEYPLSSRRLGEQGGVVVRVLINTQGRADRVELQEASPYARLNEAALKAAREALYKPYIDDGVPQPAWALVPLSFELAR